MANLQASRGKPKPLNQRWAEVSPSVPRGSEAVGREGGAVTTPSPGSIMETGCVWVQTPCWPCLLVRRGPPDWGGRSAGSVVWAHTPGLVLPRFKLKLQLTRMPSSRGFCENQRGWTHYKMSVYIPGTVNRLANVSYYYSKEKEAGRTPGPFWLQSLDCIAWCSWDNLHRFILLGFCLCLSYIPFISPLTPIPMQGCTAEGRRGWEELKTGREPEPKLLPNTVWKKEFSVKAHYS